MGLFHGQGVSVLSITLIKHIPIFFFSPDELLSQIKKPLNLPLHGGPKAFAPDENSVEDELLTSMLEEQKNVLKEQRIHKRYCFKYKHYLFYK